MNDGALNQLAQALAGRLIRRGEWLATAESCTGGWIAKCLTDVAGSSGWFERGLVSYSNRAKAELLGVPEATIDRYGAVSEQTARAMTAGVLMRAPVEHAIAVTGIAGPGGGTADKPVGTVWLAWQSRGGEAQTRHCRFDGDREAVRRETVHTALAGLIARLDG